MNHLNKLIQTFTTEEQHTFTNYLQKKNKRPDAKNIHLFKLLANNQVDTKEICTILYQKDNRVAYHALRKRLYQSLIDFIANTNLEDVTTTELQTIKYLIAARNFLLQKQYSIAFKILDKAEILAQEHFQFSLLNEIYHTQIQFDYINPISNIDLLTQKFNQNIKALLAEEQLNIVYAKIRNAINKIRFQGEHINFTALFFKTLEEHQINMDDSLSFKSLYQLITISSLSASVTKDFSSIETFLEDTYLKTRNHQQKQKQLFYHIQIIYHLANTYFRTKKFDKCFRYLTLMEQQMKERNKKYYTVFYLKYQNLNALCHNYSGKIDTAIAIAEKSLKKKHNDYEMTLYIQLSLSMYYFQKGDFKNALHVFSSFRHQDKWYEEKAGIEWVIKKNIMEILLHIELDNIDFTSSRLLSFKRRYYPYLKKVSLPKVIVFINLVEELFKHPELKTDPIFITKTEKNLIEDTDNQEDIFVMSFYAWLKAKNNGESLYSTTLSIVQNNEL